MAEPSGEKGFGKAFTRKVIRTKEKVLQNIGKADKTTDAEFDRLVSLFTEQQTVANHLQKEFKNYMTQVKAMATASQAMYQAICDSYESTWKNHDQFIPASERLIALWDDYQMKLNDEIQTPLTNYANKFRDLKNKIAKRSRKLTDYDGARHTVAALEGAKKRDEVKISRAHEELSSTKSIYDSIHNELYEELPALYASRIPVLSRYFSAFFNSEAKFQAECSKIKNELNELIEDVTETEVPRMTSVASPPAVVQRVSDQHKMAFQKTSQKEMRQSDEITQHDYLTLIEMGADDHRIASEASDVEDTDRVFLAEVSSKMALNDAKSSSVSSGSTKHLPDKGTASASSSESIPKNLMPAFVDLLETHEAKTNSAENNIQKLNDGSDDDEASNRAGNVRLSAGSADHEYDKFAPKGGFLYKVIASHLYEAEDPDELTFEKGDIIGVITPDDESVEQDEGWLFGVKCSTGEKGVFPANFTQKFEQ